MTAAVDPAAPWLDSHCHLQERYLPQEAGEGPPATLPEELARAWEAGVGGLVCVGTDAATSAQALALATAARGGGDHPDARGGGDHPDARGGGDHPDARTRVWATAGLHPHEAAAGTAEVTALVDGARQAGNRLLVAVGECGLDYHYDHSPRPVQRQAFAEQVALAHRHHLALVIHVREAWDDLFGVLQAEGVPERTVLHCFTGGPTEARRCLDAGMFLSFSGIVSFKNAPEVREAAALCPADRLLVETDSPFLAPVPHRGQPNQPAYVPLVGAVVAEVRGVAPDEVAHRSAAAAAAAFAL